MRYAGPAHTFIVIRRKLGVYMKELELHEGGGHALSVSTYKLAAYTTIRDMIVELELPPGTRLVEKDLAELLRISKTPIREAIAALEADGLVDMVPYRGATVRFLSIHEMEEQSFLIDAIELPVIPVVVERITKDALAELGQILRQLKRARARRDGPLFRRLTSATHAILFEPVGYPRLQKFISTLVGPVGLRYDRVFVDNFDDTWDMVLDLHVRRYQAILNANPEEAIAVVTALRAQIGDLNRSRVTHPDIASYFERTNADS